MKAIIVDDEKHVREGLLLLVDWEKHGIDQVLEAVDGKQAMSYISEYKPEIIFTDMNMPRCDGIDLLKWIDSCKLNAKTIVLSGYDDFRYTKNAITFGSFDYLLKPINPDELDETVTRAIKKWKEENRERLMLLENEKVIIDRLLTTNLQQSTMLDQVVQQISKREAIDIKIENYTIVIIPMDVLTRLRFDDDEDKAFNHLLPICNNILTKRHGIAFRHTNKKELILLFWQPLYVKKVVSQITFALRSTLQFECMPIIGRTVMNLNEAYDTATQLIGSLNLLSKNHYNKKSAEQYIYLLDQAEEVRWAIQSGNMEQLDQVILPLFDQIMEDRSFTVEQLKSWENQFDMLREHWLKEYEIKQLNVSYRRLEYWDDYGNFSFELFKKEKLKEFHELMQLVYNVKFKKEESTVQRIEEYIRLNYQKDIKLQDIAERFYLSREYISRKFKQEYHATITDYMTRIRIEKAKELLENPFLKIYEIAIAVGYQNDKYFIKVFKKIEGITPKDYRNKIKSVRSE
ncbi:response regulator transcription factor [Halalkalibacter krulwichiae]|uniref:Putative response regulatory protein n=1 Tax=Halalkalibacter krulwichiae TaxID=199441 RepID=A0A1X9MCR2_9BACI|nr:response regulator [Halalkalibacter krulwichiae]ARK31225.1 putative response regulatory protein [Halalkalibacter krulwichiae]